MRQRRSSITQSLTRTEVSRFRRRIHQKKAGPRPQFAAGKRPAWVLQYRCRTRIVMTVELSVFPCGRQSQFSKNRPVDCKKAASLRSARVSRPRRNGRPQVSSWFSSRTGNVGQAFAARSNRPHAGPECSVPRTVTRTCSMKVTMWTIRRRIIGNGHFRTSIATFVSVMNLISMNVTRGIDRSPRWGSEICSCTCHQGRRALAGGSA